MKQPRQALEVVIASGNPHKIEEIRGILSELDLPLTIIDPPEPLPAIIEDGETLEANAIKKAVETARALGLPTLADDTGLEIDALGGKPGVYSARWAGPDCDPEKNMAKVLDELEGVPESERTARFRTVVALCVNPDEEPIIAEGMVTGRIAETRAGGGGFGYDPIFHLPELGRRLAELGEDEKNRLSHRFRALEALKRALAR